MVHGSGVSAEGLAKSPDICPNSMYVLNKSRAFGVEHGRQHPWKQFDQRNPCVGGLKIQIKVLDL